MDTRLMGKAWDGNLWWMIDFKETLICWECFGCIKVLSVTRAKIMKNVEEVEKKKNCHCSNESFTSLNIVWVLPLFMQNQNADCCNLKVTALDLSFIPAFLSKHTQNTPYQTNGIQPSVCAIVTLNWQCLFCHQSCEPWSLYILYVSFNPQLTLLTHLHHI